MKLFATLYLDEDVSVLIGTLLQVRGLDVTTAREEGKLGESDEIQLAYAASLDRCILTHNRLDFEQLHTAYFAQDKYHAGIIIAARRDPYELARRVSVLFDLLSADEIAHQLLYV
jgi:predicted nuclease of predicted toxin-antitoxin system